MKWVTLHLPPPEIFTFLRISFEASNTLISALIPFVFAISAHLSDENIPLAHPPIIAILVIFFDFT